MRDKSRRGEQAPSVILERETETGEWRGDVEGGNMEVDGKGRREENMGL